MTPSLPRHETSLPAYKRHLEKIQKKRESAVAGLVEAPFSVDISLNSLARSAKICLAMDPDASELYTWESWTTWMQVSEALLAMSTTPPGKTIERLINDKTRTLQAIGPSPSCDAGTWITAFFLAVSCRDEERVHSLCQIPASFLREAGESGSGGYDDYVYPWITAIQDYILNRPELADNLYEAMRLSQPEHASISSPEKLDAFVFPPINALYRLAQLDTDKFDEAFGQGIQLFHGYYTADQERTKDLNGALPLTLVGVACLAHDMNQIAPDFTPDLSSDYLPKHILQRSWYGEFPI
ncbi:immunity 49 family protein [Nocardiopsis sp. NPDC058631]|uniref:immunity 49 family protein n=1 Tax=Nocardiopsis sp. NPDC058631 TaxID=3346566 RepID=UPI00365BF4E5